MTELRDYVSKASNSPFTGMKLRGQVIGTVVGGRVKYLDREALEGSRKAAQKKVGGAKKKK